MTSYLYIALGIFSSWLIFYSILLYNLNVLDMSFDFHIIHGKQRIKYWGYIFLCILLSYYILIIRINRMGNGFNIYETYFFFKEFLYTLNVFDRIFLFIIFLLTVIFWIMLLRCIYQYLKKCVLALYLYYYSYDKFRYICRKILLLKVAYQYYVFNRVNIFTNNRYILHYANLIWPISFDFFERNIFTFFIPYLVVYDIVIYEGFIFHTFDLMPWFYVYSLIRSSIIVFFKIHKSENWEIAIGIYGYREGFKI